MAWIPNEDGITHLNVYSKARTALGKWLSNFARSPIDTEDGHFDSIEGYWYWLGTESPEREELRTLVGWKAKEFGRSIRALDWQQSDEFKEKICKAIGLKLKSNPGMLQQLKDNTLPLTHYYVYGPESVAPKVVEPSEGRWILDFINNFEA